MGDYTSLQVTIYDCPTDKVYEVMQVLENHQIGEEYGSYKLDTKELHLGESYVTDEISCGSSDEIYSELVSISEDIAFEVWEDPKYEWMGSLNRWVPGMGHYGAECDSNGGPMFSSDTLITKIKDGSLNKDTVDDFMGEKWNVALAALATKNKNIVLKVETFADTMWAQLDRQGTACSETAYCGEHIAANRVTNVPVTDEEVRAVFKLGPEVPIDPDRPITAHVDASGNEVLRCQVCGKRTQP